MINIEGGLGAELGGGLTSLNIRARLRRVLLFARRFYISRIGSGWKSKTGISLINRSRRGILELAFACHKFFADVAGATTSFTITECACYFSGVLSLPDALGKFLFPIPDWFASLPAPSVSFDQSAPSYAEIASIINKARGALQPVPLTKSASLR